MFRRSGFRNFILTGVLAALVFSTGCAQQQGQRQQAVKLYVDAMMLNELDEKQQAIEKLIAAIELDPEFALAYSLQGDIYQAQARHEESAGAYEAATQLDPWAFWDFFNLGKVSEIMEQFARAVKAYVRACELKSEHFDSHIGAARCYYELKDYDQSFDYGQMAKQIDPNMSGPAALLGDIYELKKDHASAIASYRRALEIQGNKPEIMVSLAVAYLRTQRYSTAKELLTSAIEIDPQNGPTYQYLGFANLKLHDINTAIANYKRAVDIDSRDWMARKGLGVAYILKAINNPNDNTFKEIGIEQWNISLDIKPDQPKLRRLLDKYSE